MREGWKEVTIGDVIKKIIGGGTPSKANVNYWNGNVFWCSVKDMVNDIRYLYYTEDKITIEGLKNSASNLIPKGTVITSTRMGLGKAFINGVDMAINQDLKALIPNDKINNKFLLYTILFNKDIIDGLGTGATVKGIKLETLKSLKINLPPLENQKKIATILSGYDDLIENNLKRIKILEEMAQQTYEEWFVRMRFPGYESAAIDTDTGLPQGWEKVKLGDVSKIKGGKRLPIGHDFSNDITLHPYIRVRDLQNGSVRFDDLVYITENTHLKIKRYTISKDDIYISIAGSVGLVGIIPPFLSDANLTENCAKITDFSSQNLQNYIYHFLNSPKGQYLISSRTGGASQPKLALSRICTIPILFPNNEILDIFSLRLKTIRNISFNLQKQNQRLREARDILLPRLMNGMIEV